MRVFGHRNVPTVLVIATIGTCDSDSVGIYREGGGCAERCAVVVAAARCNCLGGDAGFRLNGEPSAGREDNWPQDQRG
jgi:hypothetical protein